MLVLWKQKYYGKCPEDDQVVVIWRRVVYCLKLYLICSVMFTTVQWLTMEMFRWMMPHSWSAVRWSPTAYHCIRNSRRALHDCVCRGPCRAARFTKCGRALVPRKILSPSWKTKACERASATMRMTRHHLTGKVVRHSRRTLLLAFQVHHVRSGRWHLMVWPDAKTSCRVWGKARWTCTTDGWMWRIGIADLLQILCLTSSEWLLYFIRILYLQLLLSGIKWKQNRREANLLFCFC